MKNVNQFLALNISEISSVYTGKDKDCRCGCSGYYISTSFMDKPRSVVNDKMIIRKLSKAKNGGKTREKGSVEVNGGSL